MLMEKAPFSKPDKPNVSRGDFSRNDDIRSLTFVHHGDFTIRRQLDDKKVPQYNLSILFKEPEDIQGLQNIRADGLQIVKDNMEKFKMVSPEDVYSLHSSETSEKEKQDIVTFTHKSIDKMKGPFAYGKAEGSTLAKPIFDKGKAYVSIPVNENSYIVRRNDNQGFFAYRVADDLEKMAEAGEDPKRIFLRFYGVVTFKIYSITKVGDGLVTMSRYLEAALITKESSYGMQQEKLFQDDYIQSLMKEDGVEDFYLGKEKDLSESLVLFKGGSANSENGSSNEEKEKEKEKNLLGGGKPESFSFSENNDSFASDQKKGDVSSSSSLTNLPSLETGSVNSMWKKSNWAATQPRSLHEEMKSYE